MGQVFNKRRYMGGKSTNPFIQFDDANVKAICVAQWGGADGGSAPLNTRVNNTKVTGVAGEITYKQAASVEVINNGSGFRYNTDITSFNELQYFTGLTTIKVQTFQGCTNLTSIYIPDSVTNCENNSFITCSSLSKVYVDDIGVWLSVYFNNQNACPLNNGAGLYDSNDNLITSVTIPSSITSIGTYQFVNYTALTSMSLHSNVTSIGTYAFYGCTGLSSVDWSTGLTSIGIAAFQGSGIASATLPKGVTSISNNTFRQCASLTTFTAEGAITIGATSAYNCTSLTTVVLGSSVTNIGYAAFNQCNAITSFTCKATTPPTLSNNSIPAGASSMIIYVPAGSVDTYKAANGWSSFASKIQAIPT